jgi:hypothetical protein
MYFRKALEAEPERIGWATLDARGFFATDANTNEQRFASYMDYYEWLLSIDEKTLKEKALPRRPPGTRPPEGRPVRELDETHKELVAQMKKRMRVAQLEKKRPAQFQSGEGGFLGLIKGQAETTARNHVHEALGRMAIDPQTGQWSEARAIEHLIMLVERFPGASAAERAKAELARIRSGVVADAVSALEDNLDVSSLSPPESKSELSNAETDPNNESRSMLSSQKGKETHRASVFAWCAGLIALVVISLCVARPRVRAHRSGGKATWQTHRSKEQPSNEPNNSHKTS